MNFLQRVIDEHSNADSEFRAEYESERLLLVLIRARQQAGLTQRELALKLGVSQPRIAQVERGTRPMSAQFMIRYAAAVGFHLELMPDLRAS